MKENYQYPLDYSWSQEEIIKVMDLFNGVEKVYEKGLEKEKFQKIYAAFKQVIPSIGEEKRLDKAFFAESGYSIYQVVKKMKTTNGKIIKMEGK